MKWRNILWVIFIMCTSCNRVDISDLRDWWHRKGYNIPEQMPELECDRPIFANAYAQVSSNNDRLFAAFTSNWYWSSTEAGAGSAWGVTFCNGNCGTNGKNLNGYVSPVVAIEKSSL